MTALPAQREEHSRAQSAEVAAHLQHAQALEEGAGRHEDLHGVSCSIMRASAACCSQCSQGLLPARLLLILERTV